MMMQYLLMQVKGGCSQSVSVGFSLSSPPNLLAFSCSLQMGEGLNYYQRGFINVIISLVDYCAQNLMVDSSVLRGPLGFSQVSHIGRETTGEFSREL